MKHYLLDDNIQLVTKIIQTLKHIQVKKNDEVSNRIKTDMLEWFSNRLKELKGLKDGTRQLILPTTDSASVEDLPHLTRWYDAFRKQVVLYFRYLVKHLGKDDVTKFGMTYVAGMIFSNDKACVYKLKWILHVDRKSKSTKNGNNPSLGTNHHDPQLSRGYRIAALLRY